MKIKVKAFATSVQQVAESFDDTDSKLKKLVESLNRDIKKHSLILKLYSNKNAMFKGVECWFKGTKTNFSVLMSSYKFDMEELYPITKGQTSSYVDKTLPRELEWLTDNVLRSKFYRKTNEFYGEFGNNENYLYVAQKISDLLSQSDMEKFYELTSAISDNE